MQDNSYHLTLTGQLQEGTALASALTAFAALFKVSEEKAQQTLAQAPVNIKRNVDLATAEKFKTAIEKTGFICQINVANDALVTATNVSAPEQQAIESQVAVSEVKTASAPATFKGLSYKIEGRPDYSFLTIQIPANQTLKVEASSMATMDTHLVMKTKLKGGLGRFLTGESLFINEFTAERAAGEIGLAPGTPGDLFHQYLDGQAIFIQNSAFVAATQGVTLETKWQGMMKGFFSGESFFLIRCSGKGDLWFNSYGAIIEIDVEEDYVVDSSNIVAFTEGLNYHITKVGGYKSLFFSGEGFVCRFTGKGKVWIQTRSAQAFTSWAHYYRPVQSSK